MEHNKTVTTSNNEDFQIYDLLLKALHNWYWFVLSLLLCGVGAFLYLKSSPYIYVRNAAVLIKDNTKSSAPEISAFEDLGIFKSNTNINNEVMAFQSPNLMREVVNRLSLNISYMMQDGLRKKELYSQSPVRVSFPDVSDESSFSFFIELKPNNKAVLSRFTYGGAEVQNGDMTVNLSDSVTTPVGTVIVSPSLYYSAAMFNEPIQVTKSNLKNATSVFSGKFTAELSNKETSIVILSIRDVSVTRADDILNTLIAVYNENWVTDKSMVTVNTSKIINERLGVISQELGGIDDSIAQFKSKNFIANVQIATTMVMNESSEYTAKIFEINNQLSIVNHIRNNLNDQSKTAELLSANTGLNNADIQARIGEYNALLLKRDKQIANSSEKHPVIIEMNNSIVALRQSILRSVENQIVTLNLQLSALKEQDARTIKRIESSPGQEKHLTSVERQQKIKEALYLYLLQKREENVLSQAITINNTRIINSPSGTDAPVEPKARTIMLAALILGFVFPFGILWLKDTLNTTVRGKNDLNGMAVPFLGEIPLADKKLTKQHILVVKEKNRDMINEAFRLIRTNMAFIGSADMKTVMLTSFNAGSGKTFVTMNLAMSFALTGKKTLVIDLDMRKASLSKHAPGHKNGISACLSGMITDEHEVIIKNYRHDNLDLIPVGTIPPNPAELLLSPRFEQLIDRLKAEYDIIFIDCTPVDLVTDAAIVGNIADFTIFMVREGLLDRRMLPNIDELYHKKQFNGMAVLLNGTDYASHYGYRRYGKYEYSNS